MNAVAEAHTLYTAAMRDYELLARALRKRYGTSSAHSYPRANAHRLGAALDRLNAATKYYRQVRDGVDPDVAGARVMLEFL